ncbi:MAG: hypothetical protein MUF55_01450 [Hydrogenophaga sp.]|jgi:hypothetical protein|nr:hypothetical protein [Hydrogenophaga sp.]
MTRALWLELLVVVAVAVAAVAAIPLQAGVWGWSWDALNHHIYLGLISESPRWSLDVIPASTQGWQYPYLYWPVYRLAELPIDGATAGALWGALLVLLLVPPVWLLSLRLLPRQGSAIQSIFERSAATALALSSVVLLSALGTTANDPLAAVPLMWALAIMAVPQASDRRAALAAALWGMAVAFKLTAVLAAPFLLVWWWQRPKASQQLRRGLAMAAAAGMGYALTHAPWGWQLWQQTGNPVYPLLPGLFGG